MSNVLTALIEKKGALLLDGAAGTNLFSVGLGPGEPPEPWNINHPDEITQFYQGWVDAGSDIFLTNSFGGNRFRLKLHGLIDEVTSINQAGARLAREVADNAGRDVLVAGSMGPTGEMYAPLGSLSIQVAEAAYLEQATALKAGGVDVLWIETIFSMEEFHAAVRAAQSTGLPVCATMSFDSAGRTMMGITPEQLASEAQKWGLQAFGANCGLGAADTTKTIMDFALADHNCPIIAKGNCGVPSFSDGAIRYSGSVTVMADYVDLVYAAGARIIGGCCGTTTAHLKAMRQRLDACLSREPAPIPTLNEITEKLGPLSEGAAAYAAKKAGKTADENPRRNRRRRSS